MLNPASPNCLHNGATETTDQNEKIICIDSGRTPHRFTQQSAQTAANKRNKEASIFKRLRAGQTLVKIMLAERVGWLWLTKLIVEYIDWPSVPTMGRSVAFERRVA